MLSRIMCGKTVRIVKNAISAIKLNKCQLDNYNVRFSTRSVAMDYEQETITKIPIPQTVLSTEINPNRMQLLERNGITSLFPVQTLCFDPILKGENIIAQAPTGQGKTLAFLLPLFEKIESNPSNSRNAEVLVLSPTRELVQQTYSECQKYARNIPSVPIYGGVGYEPQENALRRGVKIILATPGRLTDLMDKGVCGLSNIKYIVLDEADRMLEMGFKEQLDKILENCNKLSPQYLLFSATMPAWINDVVHTYMTKDPVRINLVQNLKASADVNHLYYLLKEGNAPSKSLVMSIHNKISSANGKTLIFCAMKRECDILKRQFQSACGVLHGDISQNLRSSTLSAFARGDIHVLVATDVASRGLDIKNVDLVLNLGLPRFNSGRIDVESYIHRSGRTGRAGKKGVCLTFVNDEELNDISFMKHKINNPFTEYVSNDLENHSTFITDILTKSHPDKNLSSTIQDVISKFGIEDALARAITVINKQDAIDTTPLFSNERTSAPRRREEPHRSPRSNDRSRFSYHPSRY